MYNKILDDIQEPYYQLNYSNDGQRFVAWYLMNIHSRDMNYAKDNNLIDQIVGLAGKSLNFALESAANEPQPANRVFSPQNWIRTKSCLVGIRAAVSQSLMMMPIDEC